MNFWSYFVSQKIFETPSKYNGTVSIEESFGKKYLYANGQMQSGPYLERIWRKGIIKLGINHMPIQTILILGFGAGSFAKIISKLFPGAHITGIDIDPVMLFAAKKHFNSYEISNCVIEEANAKNFVKKMLQKKARFDLVFVDLYHGYSLPAFAEKDDFIQNAARLVSNDGVFLFNRLYFQKYRDKTDQFLDKLHKNFQDIQIAKIYSNLLICIKP